MDERTEDIRNLGGRIAIGIASIGGITIEAIRRQMHRRRQHRTLPRMIVRRSA